MQTDPIADMFARIKNAIISNRRTLAMPSSKIKVEIAKLLQREGYIEGYQVAGESKKPVLEIAIKFDQKGQALIKELKRVSSPGHRRYLGYKDLPRHFHGMGMHIISTSKGLVTNKEAHRLQLGGEWIATVF